MRGRRVFSGAGSTLRNGASVPCKKRFASGFRPVISGGDREILPSRDAGNMGGREEVFHLAGD
jgi:hypothetical protein